MTLTSAQVAEWWAFYQLEPWGNRVDWLRTGTIAATIANANSRRGGRIIHAEDVIPPDVTEPAERTPARQRGVFDSIVNLFKSRGMLKIKEGSNG